MSKVKNWLQRLPRFRSAVLDLPIERGWYHEIEISPGVYTPGKGFFNIAATRHLLRNCEVSTRRCLDVGTMDGLVSILLCRRAASEVFACDRYDRTIAVKAIQRSLGIKFRYLGGLTLREVRERLPRISRGPMDVVVFSGVLYHMYDPMVGLALVRSMVRTGGLVLIETNAVDSSEMVAFFNHAGQLVPDPNNYWNPSTSLLDYLLRFFRLTPIDCCHISIPQTDPRQIRLGVVCRAIALRTPSAGDEWMSSPRDDDVEFPDWPGSSTDLVGYSREGFVEASINLHDMVRSTSSLVYGPEDIRLKLDSCY